MSVEIITKEDLLNFRVQLLTEIKLLLIQQPTGNRQWLKPSEVRQMLKISAATLQHLRDSGKIPYSRMGGIIYYRYDEIEKLLNH